MKKFLFFAVLPSLLIGVIIQIFLIRIVDGETDPFYLRFTNTNSTNLLLGTSRVAQGIQPKVINEILNIESYNFAFTVAHSPYGEVYNQAIFKKLNTNIKKQVFIIGVDPWSISSTSENPNSTSEFRENKLSLAHVKEFNRTPNFQYLGEFLVPYRILKSYLNKNPPITILREDGWLEVNVDMDPVQVEKRIESKMRTYRERNLPFYKFSSSRKKSLLTLVKRLDEYGEVFLVRLPVHPEMMSIENELLPFFKDSIQDVVNASSGYLDLTNENADHTYTDGNHLHKSSGKIVSEKVANWIKSQ